MSKALAGDQARVIADALARTREAGGARIELRIGARPLPTTVEQPMMSVLRHPMRSFAGWVVEVGSAARSTEGVIDLRSRRYMLFGPYAQVYVDGEHRGGRPGRSLSSLRLDRDGAAVPLWLCDLLDGVSAARETAVRSFAVTRAESSRRTLTPASRHVRCLHAGQRTRTGCVRRSGSATTATSAGLKFTPSTGRNCSSCGTSRRAATLSTGPVCRRGRRSKGIE